MARWALVDDTNIVQNLIEYDGVAEYAVPVDLHLRQVEEWVQIGNDADMPKPIPD